MQLIYKTAHALLLDFQARQRQQLDPLVGNLNRGDITVMTDVAFQAKTSEEPMDPCSALAMLLAAVSTSGIIRPSSQEMARKSVSST